MNFTNFKFIGPKRNEMRSLHISRDHIIAIKQTEDGTRIYATGGVFFDVPEDIENVREHLYSKDFWPETYQD